MKPVNIIASPADTDAVCSKIGSLLADQGPVGLIDREPPDNHSLPPGVNTRYTITQSNTWTATGIRMDVSDALDTLSTDHDYVLIKRCRDLSLPAIVINESYDGDVIARADSVSSLDPEMVLDGIAQIEPHETLHSLVNRIKQSQDADRAGAIATFTGRVRERDSDDDVATTYLEFEKYDPVAKTKMDSLARELESRDDVYRVLMHHRNGIVRAGEDIVFVVVLAGHRDQAFKTVQDGINRLKAEIPIFKKEVTTDETFWVHDTT